MAEQSRRRSRQGKLMGIMARGKVHETGDGGEWTRKSAQEE
jgi:hypothetical protein